MQAVDQNRNGTHAQIAVYLLRALPVLYGATAAVSYGYLVYQRLASETLRPSDATLPVTIVVPFIFGWLIERKHPGHTFALFFLVMAYSSAVATVEGLNELLYALLPALHSPAFESVALVLGHTMWIPGVFIPLFLMPLYFPTGQLLSPRWRAVVLFMMLFVVQYVVTIIFRPWPWPEGGIPDMRAFNGIAGSGPFFDSLTTYSELLTLPVIPLIGIAVFYRYRRSRGVERAQMKWPIFAVLCFIGLAIVQALFPAVTAWDERHGYPLTWSMAMMFPISIGVAILRHNLWDIDLIINRTLVYATLTASIVGAYIGVVSLFSSLFHGQSNTVGGLIAVGIIAVLFQPLRERLQRGANRLLYGERDDPAAVLTRLAQQLAMAEGRTSILPDLVQTIAFTLKIPYVAILMPGDVPDKKPVAAWGEAPERTRSIPLTYQKEVVGHLVVAPRGRRDAFDRREQELLATIAALTATTVRAVQLSDELRDSRRRIITAREEERRRLRRDLHDGLGPQLASQTLGLEAVDQLIVTNPQKAHELLASLKAQAQEAIQDVRRVVYGLRPPALDDLGLVSALQQSGSRYETDRLRFTFEIDEPLRTLPAAVETAAYRIAQEAMTNIVRHAKATNCTVRLYATNGYFVVEVRDNGRGLPRDLRSGIGLRAMGERAAELNGRCDIESLPGGGTLVRARLPSEAANA